MRQVGQTRLADGRVSWVEALPASQPPFDRILCGAAIWQVESPAESLGWLAGCLRRGGALCFNLPALYLGEPDEPGGGEDPLLMALPAALMAEGRWTAGSAAMPFEVRSPSEMERLLAAAGLQPERWSFRQRFPQAAYRDWLKIPVLTNRLLGGLDPLERARRIDAAYRRCPRDSWRWERWVGWTAWKDKDNE
jgi:hypothetical protein